MRNVELKNIIIAPFGSNYLIGIKGQAALIVLERDKGFFDKRDREQHVGIYSYNSLAQTMKTKQLFRIWFNQYWNNLDLTQQSYFKI